MNRLINCAKKERGARKELLEIVRDVDRKMAEKHQGFTPDISSMTLTKACYLGKTRRGKIYLYRIFILLKHATGTKSVH